MFNTKTFTVNDKLTDDSIDSIFQLAANNTEFVLNIVKSMKAINKIFDSGDGFYRSSNMIDEDRITNDSICNSIKSMANSFKRDYMAEELKDGKPHWIGTGYGKYILTNNGNSISLQVIFEHIFECSIMESELWNPGCFNDVKY